METFSLKWKNFQSNVTKSFQRLRYEEEYSDVTLMGDDFQPLQAHKVVLSSCSEYFKNVLLNSRKHSHPVLCMEGINKHDLTNILDYVYNGEIQLYQDEVDRFITISDRYKLDGLIGPTTEIDEKPGEITLQIEVDPNVELSTVSDIIPEREMETEPNTVSHKQEIVDEKPVEIPLLNDLEPNAELNIVSDISEPNKVKQEIVMSPSENKNKLNVKFEELFKLEMTGMFTCNICPKVAKHKSHMKEHVEIHTNNLKYQCKLCDKSYKQGSTLRSHIAKIHKLRKKELEFQVSQGFFHKKVSIHDLSFCPK